MGSKKITIGLFLLLNYLASKWYSVIPKKMDLPVFKPSKPIDSPFFSYYKDSGNS
jgi:hypothetical protein